MKSKEYYLFTFPNYYPLGGFNDFKGQFNTFEEAIDFILNLVDPEYEEQAHVVFDGKIVFKAKYEDEREGKWEEVEL